MSREIKEIIGEREERELRNEVADLLNTEGVTYDDMEELLLGYGLEMDYFERLCF